MTQSNSKKGAAPATTSTTPTNNTNTQQTTQSSTSPTTTPTTDGLQKNDTKNDQNDKNDTKNGTKNDQNDKNDTKNGTKNDKDGKKVEEYPHLTRQRPPDFYDTIIPKDPNWRTPIDSSTVAEAAVITPQNNTKYSKRAKFFIISIIIFIFMATISNHSVQEAALNTLSSVGIVNVPQLEDRMRDLHLTVKRPIVIIPGIVTSQLQVFSSSYPTGHNDAGIGDGLDGLELTVEDLNNINSFGKFLQDQIKQNNPNTQTSSTSSIDTTTTQGQDNNSINNGEINNLEQLYTFLMENKQNLFQNENFDDLISTFDSIFTSNTTTTQSTNQSSQSTTKNKSTQSNPHAEPITTQTCMAPTPKTTLWGGNTMVNYILSDPSCWIKHLRLNSTSGLDNNYVKLRAVEGQSGGDYLITGYWVWARVLSFLEKVTPNPDMVYMATYDWRQSFKALELRDGYFTKMKQTIERMVQTHGEKVVIVNHSMGGLVTQYLLSFISWSENERVKAMMIQNGDLIINDKGEMEWANEQSNDDDINSTGSSKPCRTYPHPSDWFNNHIDSIVNIASPSLGVAKAVSALLTGEMKDIAALGEMANFLRKATILNERAVTQLLRSFHSVGSMIPKGGDVVWGGEFNYDGVMNPLSSLLAYENDKLSKKHDDLNKNDDKKYTFSAADDLYGFSSISFDYETIADDLAKRYGLFVYDNTSLLGHLNTNDELKASTNKTQRYRSTSSLGYDYQKYINERQAEEATMADEAAVVEQNQGAKLELFLNDMFSSFDNWLVQHGLPATNFALNSQIDNDEIKLIDPKVREDKIKKCLKQRTQLLSTPYQSNDDDEEYDLVTRYNQHIIETCEDIVDSGQINTFFETSPLSTTPLSTDTFYPVPQTTPSFLTPINKIEKNIQDDPLLMFKQSLQTKWENLTEFFNQKIATATTSQEQPSRSTFKRGQQQSQSIISTPAASSVHSTAKVAMVQGFTTLLKGIITTVQQVQAFHTTTLNTIVANMPNKSTQIDSPSDSGIIVDDKNLQNLTKKSPHDTSQFLHYLQGFLHKIQLQPPVIIPVQYQSWANMVTMVKRDMFDIEFIDPEIDFSTQQCEIDENQNENNNTEKITNYDGLVKDVTGNPVGITPPAPPTCYYDHTISIKICNSYKIDFISTFQTSLMTTLMDDIQHNSDHIEITDFFQILSSWTSVLTLPSHIDVSPQEWRRQKKNLTQKSQDNINTTNSDGSDKNINGDIDEYDLDFIKVLAKEWFYSIVKYVYSQRQTHHVFSTSFNMQDLILQGRKFVSGGGNYPRESNHWEMFQSLENTEQYSTASQFIDSFNTTLNSHFNIDQTNELLGGIPTEHDFANKNATNPVAVDVEFKTADLWNTLKETFPSQSLSSTDKTNSSNTATNMYNTVRDYLEENLNKFANFPASRAIFAKFQTLASSQKSDFGKKVTQKLLNQMNSPWNGLITERSGYDQSVAFVQGGVPVGKFEYNTSPKNKFSTPFSQQDTPSSDPITNKNNLDIDGNDSGKDLHRRPMSLRRINLHSIIPDLLPTLDLISIIFPIANKHINHIRTYSADTTCIISDNHKYIAPNNNNQECNHPMSKLTPDGNIRGCLWDLLHREAPMYSEKTQYEYAFGAAKTPDYQYKTIFDIEKNKNDQNDDKVIIPTSYGAVYTFDYPHRTSYMSNYWVDMPLLLSQPQSTPVSEDKKQLNLIDFVKTYISNSNLLVSPTDTSKSDTDNVIKTRFKAIYDQIGIKQDESVQKKKGDDGKNKKSDGKKNNIKINFIETPFEYHNWYHIVVQLNNYVEYLESNVDDIYAERNNMNNDDNDTKKDEKYQENINNKILTKMINTINSYNGYPNPLPISSIFTSESFIDTIKSQFCLIHNALETSLSSSINSSTSSSPHCINFTPTTNELNLVQARYLSAWGVFYRHTGGVSRQYARSTLLDPIFSSFFEKNKNNDNNIYAKSRHTIAKLAIQHLDIQLHSNYLLFDLFLTYSNQIKLGQSLDANKMSKQAVLAQFDNLMSKSQLLSSFQQQLSALSSYTIDTTTSYRIHATSYTHVIDQLPVYLQDIAKKLKINNQKGKNILPSTHSHLLPTITPQYFNPSLPSFLYNDVDDREWSNVLTVKLPARTNFDYYSFYGVNKEAERTYFYSGASAMYSTHLDYAMGASKLLTPSVGMYLGTIMNQQPTVYDNNDPNNTIPDAHSNVTNDSNNINNKNDGSSVYTVINDDNNHAHSFFNFQHHIENGVGLANGDGTVPLLSMAWVNDKNNGFLSRFDQGNDYNDLTSSLPPRKFITRQYNAEEHYSPYLDHYTSTPIDLFMENNGNNNDNGNNNNNSQHKPLQINNDIATKSFEQIQNDMPCLTPLLPFVFNHFERTGEVGELVTIGCNVNRLTSLIDDIIADPNHNQIQGQIQNHGGKNKNKNNNDQNDKQSIVDEKINEKNKQDEKIIAIRDVSFGMTKPSFDKLLGFRLLSNDHVDVMGNDNMLIDLLHIAGSYDLPTSTLQSSKSTTAAAISTTPSSSKSSDLTSSSPKLTSKLSQLYPSNYAYTVFMTQYETYINITQHVYMLNTRKHQALDEKTQILDAIEANIIALRGITNRSNSDTGTRVIGNSEQEKIIDTNNTLRQKLTNVETKLAALDQMVALYTTKMKHLKDTWVDSPYGYYLPCEALSNLHSLTSELTSQVSNITFAPQFPLDCIQPDGSVRMFDQILVPSQHMNEILSHRFSINQDNFL